MDQVNSMIEHGTDSMEVMSQSARPESVVPKHFAVSWFANAHRKEYMKSMFMKSIYAGLGLIGTGKQSVEHLGRELAKRANLSEKEGEKVARQLRQHSEKAISSLQKSLNAEVNKVVKAVHAATASKVASKPKTKSKRPAARHGKGKRSH